VSATIGRWGMALLFTLVWIGVTGSFTIHNAVLGLVLAFGCIFIVRHELQGWTIRPTWGVVPLFLLFLKELALSAWKVAHMVLKPDMGLRPGIFAYPLQVTRDFEITLLANLITLTPGTLSVDVSADGKVLFVHGIDCADIAGARRDIAQGFERRIMEAFAR
jgi:multicomponent Na+:H+ antiporter subunit E